MDVERAVAHVRAQDFEVGDAFDTGVCKMAMLQDPDGNTLALHRRYVPAD